MKRCFLILTVLFLLFPRQLGADNQFIVRLDSARTTFNVFGSGIVGVIDTGIDANHPALQGVVVQGYDFTRNTPGIPSESSDLTQPVSPAVSGSAPARVNDSTAAVLDQQSV